MLLNPRIICDLSGVEVNEGGEYEGKHAIKKSS